MGTWTDRVERRLAQCEAWARRLLDRYECWIERRGPRCATRRGYVAFLRQSADEIEPVSPRTAGRQRRKADAIEREGLEITYRMDPSEWDTGR